MGFQHAAARTKISTSIRIVKDVIHKMSIFSGCRLEWNRKIIDKMENKRDGLIWNFLYSFFFHRYLDRVLTLARIISATICWKPIGLWWLSWRNFSKFCKQNLHQHTTIFYIYSVRHKTVRAYRRHANIIDTRFEVPEGSFFCYIFFFRIHPFT